MNCHLIPCRTPKLTPRCHGAQLISPFSFIIHPSHTRRFPQTPSLPVPDPANDATRKKQIPFRTGDVAHFSWVTVTADGHEGRSAIVSVTRT